MVVEKGGQFANAFCEKGRRQDPTSEGPGAVALRTIFILLVTERAYSDTVGLAAQKLASKYW